MELDIVGVDATMALGAQGVRQMGHLTIVGIGGDSYGFGFFTVPYEASVATTYWGPLPELMEVLALAESKGIRSHSSTYGFDEAKHVYEQVADGRLTGCAVIVP